MTLEINYFFYDWIYNLVLIGLRLYGDHYIRRLTVTLIDSIEFIGQYYIAVYSKASSDYSTYALEISKQEKVGRETDMHCRCNQTSHSTDCATHEIVPECTRKIGNTIVFHRYWNIVVVWHTCNVYNKIGKSIVSSFTPAFRPVGTEWKIYLIEIYINYADKRAASQHRQTAIARYNRVHFNSNNININYQRVKHQCRWRRNSE